MSAPKNTKATPPYEVISAYRRKQQRTETLLPFFWIGVMLLILGAGYLVYRYVSPAGALLIQNNIETPTPGETAAPGTPGVTEQAAAVTGSPAMVEEAALAAVIPTSTPGMTTYTIQEGDTLAGVAAAFETDMFTLQQLNPEVTPEFINVGDELTVPGVAPTATLALSGDQTYTQYTVVEGDTLAGIANAFGTTIDSIVQVNGLESADQIQVGQPLQIPVPAGGTSAASSTTAPAGSSTIETVPEATTTPTP